MFKAGPKSVPILLKLSVSIFCNLSGVPRVFQVSVSGADRKKWARDERREVPALSSPTYREPVD